MTSSPLIQLQGISKYYHLGDTIITALDDVNLTINKHENVALWGPSGSGKTTACNIIGLLDKPDLGKLFFNQQYIKYEPDCSLSLLRNKEIGIIFQNFNLLPVLSALENVMLPLQIRGIKNSPARELAEQQLSKVGLEAYYSQRPNKLSGGQQQRVAIARALVTKPSLIIADEPTANLDTKTAHRIIDLMMDINDKNGTTFIFSTHDQRLLKRVSRKILLSDGRICEDIQ
ncbi:MAG: ABC transporter ATP-binding protein [Pseudomonadota bacterium]